MKFNPSYRYCTASEAPIKFDLLDEELADQAGQQEGLPLVHVSPEPSVLSAQKSDEQHPRAGFDAPHTTLELDEVAGVQAAAG